MESLEQRSLLTLAFAPVVNYSVGVSPVAITTGDFNGDGKPDIATANKSGTVSVLLNTGGGSFSPGASLSVVGTQFSDISTADFNGDNKLDLVVASSSKGIQLFNGSGDGKFATPVTVAVTSPSKLAVADFNNDGKPDIAAVTSTGVLDILLNKGNGTFDAAVAYPTLGTSAGGITAGDFDGDGSPDVAVSLLADNGGKTINIFHNQGNGTFAAAVGMPGGANTGGITAEAFGGNGKAALPADFNGDGKTDLVQVAGSGVGVSLNDGKGNFPAQAAYVSNTNAFQAVVADFNGDGKPDIASGHNGGTNIGVLVNNGDGTFATNVNFGVRSSPQSLAVADFDGDGKPDIAAANNGSNDVSFLFNTSNAQLTLAPIPSMQVFNDSTLTVTPHATDPGHVVTYSVNTPGLPGAPTATTFNAATGVFTYTPPGTATGDYLVTITATDNSAPPLSISRSFHVTILPAGPSLAPIPDQKVAPGGTLHLTAVGTDPNPIRVLTYTASAGTINANTGAFSYTAGASGVVSVTITVSDNAPAPRTDSKTFKITVTPTAPGSGVLSLAAIADKSIAEGGTVAFTALGSDTDPSQTLTYSSSIPGTINPTTGAFSYTAAAGPADLPVTITVTDPSSPAGVSRTFTIHVSNVAPAPSLGGGASLQVGDTLTRTGSFGDPGAQTWSATVDYGDGSGKQPLALNADKTFSLAHSYASAGTYTVAVTVTDSGGASGSATIQAVVSPPPVQVLSPISLTIAKRKVAKIDVHFGGAVSGADVAGNYRLALVTTRRVRKKLVQVSRAVRIKSVTYDATSHIATIVPAGKLAPNKVNQLTIIAANIRDSLGRALDGNHDGRAGGDLVAKIARTSVTILRRQARS